jgi:tRNA threonylcarbamoyladenosine biosynthesis protein TsaB
LTTLFAIDTAGDFCSLALVRGGDLDVVRSPAGHNHIEHVMPMIEALFARHGMAPAQCDAFAYASGPGSFTGLRVACTIVQGLALGSGRPVIAIGNLLALAAGAAAPDGAAGIGERRVLAAVDARMQQAYVAVHEGCATAWRVLLPPTLIAAAQLPALAAQWQPDVCAGDAAWLRGSLAADGAEMLPRVRDAHIDAGVLAQLALDRLAHGHVLAPDAAVPDYVRNDVARTVAQRTAARRAGRP